ncbi:MAG: carbamoyl phosphate synthase small subunit [Spirochaetes bacterium]|uniref:Carbamoyl phosphate synthase small chain n=1 Tax=Candidatus Gallitreponema excrementavium TaxID=2840840 RepID=A0A9D9N1M2_9SPIR|nr:carbamoyl phosphate synthase small subunit [Candidatus Gallitreponema excrementavium]
MDKTAYLVLENGAIFKGKRFGSEKNVIAEIVFTTGMTGYLETLTDKSYAGQIIVQTFPLIGNYGVIPEDFESSLISAKGYVVKHPCREPSNFRSKGILEDFLKENDIPGIYDIDTRALVKILREKGVMNGLITDSIQDIPFHEIKKYVIKDIVPEVSSKEVKILEPSRVERNVVLMDFGLKDNIARELVKRNCKVTIVPWNTSPGEIKKINPDGIMLSNGPGDPSENTLIIENLKEITRFGIPVFGICLGHQLLSLAMGYKTFKLKYGHRGGNQPVKNLETGRVYISSQNHGYAVDNDSIDTDTGTPLFINVNDGTCEGIQYKKIKAFSVQFHPEAAGGPKDTAFLFDKFIDLMEGKDKGAKNAAE